MAIFINSLETEILPTVIANILIYNQYLIKKCKNQTITDKNMKLFTANIKINVNYLNYLLSENILTEKTLKRVINIFEREIHSCFELTPFINKLSDYLINIKNKNLKNDLLDFIEKYKNTYNKYDTLKTERVGSLIVIGAIIVVGSLLEGCDSPDDKPSDSSIELEGPIGDHIDTLEEVNKYVEDSLKDD
ncbi:MAG: hypothetical protein M0R46_16820 [Candidatus Muirbacterium halophilum]|nr:hypothetical protein [Candidatus Muirbacterium halophilum]MCK9477580.1 hypothetical protein [Candidatus Muirbacterium halophilum]